MSGDVSCRTNTSNSDGNVAEYNSAAGTDPGIFTKKKRQGAKPFFNPCEEENYSLQSLDLAHPLKPSKVGDSSACFKGMPALQAGANRKVSKPIH